MIAIFEFIGKALGRVLDNSASEDLIPLLSTVDKAPAQFFVSALGKLLASKIASIESQKSVAMLDRLLEATRPVSLSGTLELPVLLRSLTINTQAVMNARRCVWYLLDEETGELYSAVAGSAEEVRIDAGYGVPGLAFQTKVCRC